MSKNKVSKIAGDLNARHLENESYEKNSQHGLMLLVLRLRDAMLRFVLDLKADAPRSARAGNVPRNPKMRLLG